MAASGTFIRLKRDVPGVLYQPEKLNGKSHIAILVMHSDADYLSFSAGEELSKRGYQVLCANVSDHRNGLDEKLLEVRRAVEYLRDYAHIRKVLLFGHSGGGTLFSAYQNLAENGAKAFQGPKKLVKASSSLDDLPPANGLMLVDSNWGNGAMRLFSLDPALVSEDDGVRLDPELDLFNPENGFFPGGSSYSPEFVARFQQMQGRRNNRLIDYALERVEALDQGRGRYVDDEPMIVPGAEQGFRNNKLYAQDIRLMSCTRHEWDLLHCDGSISHQLIHSIRNPENDRTCTNSYDDGALVTTVRHFLDSYAVRTTDEYGYDESTVRGVDWSSSYNCTTGNVEGIAVPLLVMGMTAGWEFAAAETIYENATSADKTLTYVEGADHLFRAAKALEQFPGQFGDTMASTYDYIDTWISDHGEFFNETVGAAAAAPEDTADRQ